MDEITPGIARLVAWLQGHGFETTDSGDGVTNVECMMSCAADVPHVFMRVPYEKAMSEADRLLFLLSSEAENLSFDGEDAGSIRASYDPASGECELLLVGVNDEDVWGPDPELPRKRLEYQIRYCEAWIADPPADKGMSPEEVAQGQEEYAALRDALKAKLARMTE